MARRTSVEVAPFDQDGSLLHFPRDGRKFLHNVDPVTREVLTSEQIWEDVPTDPPRYDIWSGKIVSIRRQIREYEQVYTEIDWRPNEPFSAVLAISAMRNGRSAKYVILTSPNNPFDIRTYPMFVADLIDFASLRGIEKGGLMTGRWMVAKRGENYGLRAAKDGE